MVTFSQETPPCASILTTPSTVHWPFSLTPPSQDLGIRQFLLTNLHRPDSSRPWTFRIPIHLIKEHLSQIGDFPYDAPGVDVPAEAADSAAPSRQTRTWQGKTLFIKGEKSKYINRRNLPVCDVSCSFPLRSLPGWTIG